MTAFVCIRLHTNFGALIGARFGPLFFGSLFASIFKLVNRAKVNIAAYGKRMEEKVDTCVSADHVIDLRIKKLDRLRHMTSSRMVVVT